MMPNYGHIPTHGKLFYLRNIKKLMIKVTKTLRSFEKNAKEGKRMQECCVLLKRTHAQPLKL